MKTSLYFIFIFFISFIATSQKLNVKKGVITLDKKEIALMTTVGDTYVLSTLDGEQIALIGLSGREATSNLTEIWYDVSTPDKSVTIEVDFPLTSISLNPNKMIAKFIYKKLGFISADGVDRKQVSTFFGAKTERSNKKDYDAIVALEEEGDKWLADYIINPSDYSLRDKKTDTLVAYLKFSNKKLELPLQIFDFNDKYIATLNTIDKGLDIGGFSLDINNNLDTKKNTVVNTWNNMKYKVLFQPALYNNEDDFIAGIFKAMNRGGFDKVFTLGIESVNEHNLKILLKINNEVYEAFNMGKFCEGYYIDENGIKTESKLRVDEIAYKFNPIILNKKLENKDKNVNFLDYSIESVFVFDKSKGKKGKNINRTAAESNKFCFRPEVNQEEKCFVNYNDTFIKVGQKELMIR